MDALWAPWRLAYVSQTDKTKPHKDECFVCRALAETDDRTNLLVERSAHSVAIINRFPYNNGHLLVAPKSHKADFRDLTVEETLDNQNMLKKMISVLEKTMQAEGFNVGLNLGRVAGAGLPGHLHWHIVPRWSGDTNFMPVLTDTKVMSQSLEALWLLLRENLNQQGPV